MSESKRKIFTGTEKAKVAVAAIKGLKTVNQIAQEYGVHPTQVSLWKVSDPQTSVLFKPSNIFILTPSNFRRNKYEDGY